ncbi:MAG: TlpA disulfide reductase family protein [Ferruginibacter sp.]
MKKLLAGSLIMMLGLMSCSEKNDTGKFTVQGKLENTSDQKIFLEQVFFNQKDPEVLDTGEIKNGKFTVTATGNEEGLYRLRMEKQETGYIFINDRPELNFTADAKDMSLQGPDFNTPANRSFKNFLIAIDSRQKNMNKLSQETDSLAKNKGGDSLIKENIRQLNTAAADFKSFIIKNIDTLSDPVVAMFALGYTRGIDPADLKTAVTGLSKRFPAHNGIAGIISQYNEMMTKQSAQPPAETAPAKSGMPGIGSMAPEITMADTEGKMFSLSSLRGKYVLVDFWASWCGPCRGENPNVVANYNKFKNKKFTILGVSLDEDRNAWLNAIKKDNLSWKQVSDLKGWNNATVSKYGYDGIPYNVLLDPQGKIIATDLREAALGKKLEEVLK